VRKDPNSSVSDSISSECCCRVSSVISQFARVRRRWENATLVICLSLDYVSNSISFVEPLPQTLVVLPGPSGTFCFSSTRPFQTRQFTCIPASRSTSLAAYSQYQYVNCNSSVRTGFFPVAIKTILSNPSTIFLMLCFRLKRTCGQHRIPPFADLIPQTLLECPLMSTSFVISSDIIAGSSSSRRTCLARCSTTSDAV
jgi:hypothetical protein